MQALASPAAYLQIDTIRELSRLCVSRDESHQQPRQIRRLAVCAHSITGFFALGYVPGKLIVHRSAAATAANILASETLFRLGIAAELVGQAAFTFVALALHDLLKGVSRRQGSLMVTLILASVPIAFLNELNSIAAPMLVRGADPLSNLDQPQRESLAILFLNLHHHGFVVAELFWDCGSFRSPCSCTARVFSRVSWGSGLPRRVSLGSSVSPGSCHHLGTNCLPMLSPPSSAK